MPAPIRIGLAGYGLGGRYFHAPLLASAPDCEFLGVVTTSPERRRQVAADLARPAFAYRNSPVLTLGSLPRASRLGRSVETGRRHDRPFFRPGISHGRFRNLKPNAANTRTIPTFTISRSQSWCLKNRTSTPTTTATSAST